MEIKIQAVRFDAQSIYSFRGARIENILNFKKDYPQAKLKCRQPLYPPPLHVQLNIRPKLRRA